MKRSIGYFMVLAAVILIVCSATTLFWSAYESAVEPWQKWVQGVQIVAVIGWEAGAILAIAYCWRHRFYLIAIGGSVLLVLAAAYTLSGEMRLQAGTQENSVARKSAEAGKYELVKSELDKAIKRRDLLQAQRRLTEDQQEELAELRKDINALKGQWTPLVEETSAVGIPGAAMLARWTGLNINDSGDIDALIKMAFWTMVRVFALPLAVFGMMAASQERKEASGRAKASEGPSVALKVSPPLQPRTALPERPIAGLLSRKAGNSSENPNGSPDPTPPADAAPSNMRNPHNAPVETPPARPRLVDENWVPTPKTKGKPSKAEKFADIDAPTRDWLSTGRAMPVALGLGSSGLDIWAAYNAFCIAQHPPIKPLNPSHFGRSLRRVGVASSKTARGVRYALRLVKQPVRRAA